MIIKTHQHYGDGWTWLDQLDKVDAHGRVGDGCFASFDELSEGIERMWGASPRAFDLEVWPTWDGVNGTDVPFDGEEPKPPMTMYGVRAVVGRRRDGSTILVIIHTEAYLLSDNGDTIERL